MRKFVVATLCSASLLLMGNKGCGEELKEELEQETRASADKCAEIAATLKALETRAGHCSDEFVFDLSEQDAQNCVAAHSRCDDASKGKLDDALTCFEQLGACDLATEGAFRNAADGCKDLAGSTDCGLEAFLNDGNDSSGGVAAGGGGPSSGP